jgi:hypothetical protein
MKTVNVISIGPVATQGTTPMVLEFPYPCIPAYMGG